MFLNAQVVAALKSWSSFKT